MAAIARRLNAAGLRLRREHRHAGGEVSYFEFPPAGDAGTFDSEWRHGLHGGAVETAMMLHLRPDLVRLDEIRDARAARSRARTKRMRA